MSSFQLDPPAERNNAEAVSPALDYGRSFLCALQTGAQWGRCYDNAYPVFFAFPALFYPYGTFVEGWIVFEDRRRVVLMEHGWLVSGKRIIDPTIVLVMNPTRPIYYFPGVVRSWEETDALENELFPHVRFSSFGADGMGHPGYKAAYDAALQQAQAMITTSGGKELIEVRATDVAEQRGAEVILDEEERGNGVVMLVLQPSDGED
jgi:hypothetical protein